jgi:hypothetical protein
MRAEVLGNICSSLNRHRNALRVSQHSETKRNYLHILLTYRNYEISNSFRNETILAINPSQGNTLWNFYPEVLCKDKVSQHSETKMNYLHLILTYRNYEISNNFRNETILASNPSQGNTLWNFYREALYKDCGTFTEKHCVRIMFRTYIWRALVSNLCRDSGQAFRCFLRSTPCQLSGH